MTDLNKQKVLEKYPDAIADYWDARWWILSGEVGCLSPGMALEESAWESAARRLEQTPTLPSNQEK